MFEGLSEKLSGIFVKLTRRGALSEEDVNAAMREVRRALLALQQGFRRLPGLVADGRDMGTVIFPQAPLKVFLTASAQARATRRHQQVLARGQQADYAALLADLQARDARSVRSR